MTIDEIYELSSKFDYKKLDFFVKMVAYSNFTEREIEVLYWLLERNLEPSILLAPRFKNLDNRCLGFLCELIKTNHDLEHLKNLVSYPSDLINKVYYYYQAGYDLIPLIDVDYSNWYLSFLLECLENRINLMKLVDYCNSNKVKLNYDQIYNLSICMSLALNVDSLLNNSNNPSVITKEAIKDYFLEGLDGSSIKLFMVEGNVYSDPSSNVSKSTQLHSCCVLAPNQLLAKLIACLDSELNVFSCTVKEISLKECGIIYSSLN